MELTRKTRCTSDCTRKTGGRELIRTKICEMEQVSLYDRTFWKLSGSQDKLKRNSLGHEHEKKKRCTDAKRKL